MWFDRFKGLFNGQSGGKMNRFVLMVFLIIILCACAPSEETINLHVVGTIAAIPTQTSYPTTTPYPTYTKFPTYTSFPTFTSQPTYTPQTPEVIYITPTSSPTPKYTPTETLTATPTEDPLYAPHGPGVYLVNIDIGHGIWRSDSTLKNDGCYWEITDNTGDIHNNYLGFSGGTMYLSQNAFQVEMDEDCGMWTFFGFRD